MRKPEVNETLAYIEKVFAPEDPILRGIRDRLRAHGIDGINVGPVEGKMLQLLMQMNRVRTVVEVGTLFGYSATWMARALPDDGHLYTLEKDPLAIANAKRGFAEAGLITKVTLLEGDALSSLASLGARGPFDMVFIDANKSGYVDVLNWAEKNIRSGGLIIGDNTLLFGTVTHDSKPDGVSAAQWDGMREFNQRLGDPVKYQSVMIPTAEGLTVAIKNF